MKANYDRRGERKRLHCELRHAGIEYERVARSLHAPIQNHIPVSQVSAISDLCNFCF